MRRLLSLTAVLALIALPLAACGDDDEETLTGATETTETTSGSGASGGVATAGDYLDASSADQVKAVQDAVAANSDCKGVDTKSRGEFQSLVATDAASAPADTPLSEIVSGQCTEN